MTVIRTLLMLCLVALILPWGAYARAAQTGPSVSVPEVATPLMRALGPRDQATDAARACRGKAIIGSPCGPDLALMPAAVAPRAPALRSAHRVDTGMAQHPRIAHPVWDPPKR
ncbi:hypothetical protein ILP92_14720 [Maribius pontilimi]|uniref:Uncharacterized protein n=1 Tax=Palleronia pontilimi TaxID=1964209 RepID=A0A934IGK3_9RHOB|nr:hypothetical protein [Palleronia pontilimi]MBJ3764002.1 hypothetical protein [Palleronia pontilimi]